MEEIIESVNNNVDECNNIITRNRYGALILNSTELLILDIDYKIQKRSLISRLVMTQTRTPTATDRLAEQYFAAEITQSPLLATYLGLPEGQDRYDDLSPAGLAAGAELAERTLRAAAGLTPIDAVDEVTLAVLRERLGLRLENPCRRGRSAQPQWHRQRVTRTARNPRPDAAVLR